MFKKDRQNWLKNELRINLNQQKPKSLTIPDYT